MRSTAIILWILNRGESFKSLETLGDTTFNLLRKNGITPDYEIKEDHGLAMTFLVTWGPMILLFFIFYFFLRQIQMGGGKAMSFGKSRARMLNPNSKKVNFRDVSGVEEAKEELEEVVDFLKDPKKYTNLGGKIPKGVILVGVPGTGKNFVGSGGGRRGRCSLFFHQWFRLCGDVCGGRGLSGKRPL